MNDQHQTKILEHLVSELELPDSAYETAKTRYESIGEWLGRENSAISVNDPHIFPQGSFRLGTAIRPLHGNEEYDLDLTCCLWSGISKQSVSQADLKRGIGTELESYRISKGIKAPLDEKHRCWRLEYADEMSFHMDIVPGIPDTKSRRNALAEAMQSSGIDSKLASGVAELAICITDDRLPNYEQVSDNWLGSNPEGYAKWFESRMSKYSSLTLLEKAQIDDLPIYKRKTTLQRCIQILKRHRDQMFIGAPDSKPISIIITTLAARNYSGNASLAATMSEIVNSLVEFIESDSNEVRNPVNPEENFADRWSMQRYRHLDLKHNFHLWVRQATSDFAQLSGIDYATPLQETLSRGFAIDISTKTASSLLGTVSGPAIHTKPVREIESVTSKPWYASPR